jgi:hypothetical protein
MEAGTVVRRMRSLPLVKVNGHVTVRDTDLDPVALRTRIHSATVAKLNLMRPQLSHSRRRVETSLLRLVLIYNTFRSLEITSDEINMSSSRSVADSDLQLRPLVEEDERHEELRQLDWSHKVLNNANISRIFDSSGPNH